MRNNYWIIAGVLNFLTFLLHLFGGQVSLVNPMVNSSLKLEESSQWLGAWHMVTIILLFTSIVLFLAGLNKRYGTNREFVKLIGYLNLSFCLPFIITGVYYGILGPQWIFFLPICVLTLIGLKKTQIHA